MGYDFTNGNDSGVPLNMVIQIVNNFHVPYFVETGTAGGLSIRKASLHFEHCHSIEIIEGRTPKTREIAVVDDADSTIVDYVQVPIYYRNNIHLHIGDTVSVLPKIMEQIGDNYAVFWLDAHYSDPEPSSPELVECPIIDELKIVGTNQKSIIVIDDARLFLGTPPPPLNPDKWCNVKQIFDTIHNQLGSHHITIIDDFIVAVPNEMKGNLNKFWLETYKDRYK